MNRKVFLSLLSIPLFLLQACNLPTEEDLEGTGLALTITAQAELLEAAQSVEGEEQSATFTPEAGDAPPTEEVVIAAPVLPPATGDVTVTVSVSTNCRLGPGQDFASVYGMPVGQVAKVVAKNTQSGYWIIEIPGQNGATCWLWSNYATITGDTSKLSNVIPPTSLAKTNTPVLATATLLLAKTNTPTKQSVTATRTPTATNVPPPPPASPPNPPAILSSGATCVNTSDGNTTFTYGVTWLPLGNEKGFTVSTPHGDFNYPAHVSNHNGSFVWFTGMTSVEVFVSAFNDAGSSVPTKVLIPCS